MTENTMTQSGTDLIQDLLAEMNQTTGRFRAAERNRPQRPDDSEEAVLFSAYDAMTAAEGRIQEAATGLGEDLQAFPDPMEENPGRPALTKACESILTKAEDLIEAIRGAGEPETHTESAMADLRDALDILSGRTHPRENPAPYQDEA